jgi:type II secretory ATPase GspE/PulE/Tfp pilus assembly ATPase PilB-like protein
VENLSFLEFPWVGLGLVAAMFVTVGALSGACVWVRHATTSLGIDRHDLWNLVFRGLCVAFLLGWVFVGLPALAAVWVALPVALMVFTKKRDALVADSRKYLSSKGMEHVVADLKAAWRQASGRVDAGKKMSIREQIAAMVAKAQAVANRGRVKTEKVKEAPPDLFSFVRKDGTIAMQLTAEGLNPDDGSPVSENVCNARDIMLTAIRQEATDLHFEPHEGEYFIRVRVDGVLRDVEKVNSEISRGVISAIKVFSDMDIAERRRPQDGTFAMRFGTSKYDIRVASTPTSYGEKLVMRILSGSGGVVNAGLDAVGLRVPVLKQLREIIHKPYGMFLVVGPTGSGKTTTVYASLNEIDAHQHNITTIEDPVEYRLENITQIAVNTKANVSFASILRSVLRQDPDVLLVGEIRDKETAEIACQAALTGHFVFSTLHANDSVATITRLLDLGLEPTLIQTAITAVLGQRLARRLCAHCKEPCQPPDGLVKKFKLKPGTVHHIYRERKGGCDKCKGSGYKGRMGIHELLVMNDGLRSLVKPSPSITDLKKAATASGTLTLQTDGLMKVIQGDTSVNEILRVTTS